MRKTGPSLARRLAPLTMPAAYAVFTLLVYWQLWTPIEGAQGSWRYDPRFAYWQDLIFQYRTLAEGQLALWNPYDRGGFPVYGDPQPGMLYPGNWPLLAWGFVSGEVPFGAISVKILGHWVFGAVGMHLFLRRLGAREPACYAAGLLFSFTSPKLRYGGSALNWSVAWLPWLLLAIDWFCDKPGARRGVVLGTVAAMVLLAGAPAVVMYALLLAGPFLLYRLWGRLRANIRPLAVAAGVAVLWLAPLVASNLEQLPYSVRTARNLAFITDSVFSPAHLVSFLVPKLGGENPFIGIAALLGIAAVLAGGGRGRALVFVAVAVAGVLLAFGNHAGFLPAAASALPPFSLFRRAHRYLYVTMAAIAVLAGLGLGRVMADDDDDGARQRLARALTWIGGLSTFALGVAYLVSVAVGKKVGAGYSEGFGLATASAALGTFLVRSLLVAPPRRRAIFAWALPVLIAAELWTANADAVAYGMIPDPRTDRDHLVDTFTDVEKSWRVYDRGLIDYRPGTRLGIRDFGGYEEDPLALARYELLLEAAKRQPELLGHANVRYFLDGRRQPKVRPPVSATNKGNGVYELAEVAPAVYYVPRAEVAASPEAALAALRRMTPGQAAVVEGPPPPAGPADATPRVGRITVLEPNRVVAEIDTPGPGLVVIAEAYYPPWQVTVDGQEVTEQPANVLFRGVPVTSAGHHVIEMSLRPMRFWLLLPLYAAALGLLVWAAALPAYRRRRRGSLGSSSV